MKRCFLLVALCLFPVWGLTQSTDATISGGVTDQAGNFILNADVRVANDATGIIYGAKTNSSGMYLVPILPPGRYHVQVSKPGFKTIIKADVTLNVQSAVALNFVLPVGATSESVTVNASSSLINTTDASVSTVIDRKFVENIPLNGRSFQDLISLTPGVITQSPQSNSQVVGLGGDFSVNGQRTQSNYYTVDGLSANIGSGNGGGVGEAATGGVLAGSTALGTTQALLSVDAMQEFRVQSSTYSAEYGRSPGGQFSLVSRSGTGVFHGSAFNYLRNDFFDANDWFNDHYGEPIPALRQNNFGGALGGPVSIPKIYDGRQRTFFFVSYEGLRLTQPTAATVQYVPDLFMRQQAVAAMQPILNAFPLPNGHDYGSVADPSLAEFIAPFSLPSSIDATSVRLDESLGRRWQVFFRFGDTPSSTVTRSYFARTTTSINAQTYALGITGQFSSKLSNEFRLGYARSDSRQLGVLDDFGGATPINLAAAMGAGSYEQVVPAIALSIAGIGSPLLSTYNAGNLGRQWNLVDSVNLLKGHHTLKGGVDYRFIKSVIAPPQVEPYTVFTDTQQILAGAPAVPYVFNFVPATPIFNQIALYGQDEWRIHPRLNLSMGLRWEASPPPTEQHGNDAYTLLGDLNDPNSLTVAPRGTSLWRTSWHDFAPRLGMAWVARDHSGSETILRAGGGVFFDSANEVASLGFGALGFRSSQVVTGAQIPFTPEQLVVPISVVSPYTNATIIAFPRHLQMPYTLQWNTALEQALGSRQTLTFSYVAAAGRRLIGLQETSLTALNPDFGFVEYFATGITSNYQSLQIQFQRSVTKGIHTLGSYTWSHSLDFGSNSNALPLQRGNSDLDVRNNFQAGVSWDLPSPREGALRSILLSDWGLDARINSRSAFPVTLGGNILTDPTTGNLYASGLNLVSGQPTYIYGKQYPGRRAINPAAFSLPEGNSSGDAPRNFVRGFGATQLNMALRRDISLTDSIVLHFRAEAFNLLNHPNFGYVDPEYSDVTFGQATKMLNASLGTVAAQYQQGGPRSMQFALRLSF
jgi:Carboxypeptidase regulatory-like domain